MLVLVDFLRFQELKKFVRVSLCGVEMVSMFILVSFRMQVILEGDFGQFYRVQVIFEEDNI